MFFIFIGIVLLIFSLKSFRLTKDRQDVYQIRTTEDLFEFAELVNSGNSKINAVLINDIIINDKLNSEKKYSNWKQIGEYGNDKRGYNGVFDGNNHFISGLSCISKNNAGLFGWLEVDSKIKNLKMKDSYFLSGDEESDEMISCGAICAVGYGTIENCESENNVVIARSSESSNKFSGGICGWNGGEIGNCKCYNTKITSEGEGENHSGGICGFLKNKIRNCRCGQSIVTSRDGNENNSGGICGNSLYSSEVNKCVVNKNTQIISVGKNISNAGGAVGKNLGSVNKCNIYKITTIARGKGQENNSGGICGKNIGFLSSCNSSQIKLISKGGKQNCKSGICARSEGGEIRDCNFNKIKTSGLPFLDKILSRFLY